MVPKRTALLALALVGAAVLTTTLFAHGADAAAAATNASSAAHERPVDPAREAASAVPGVAGMTH